MENKNNQSLNINKIDELKKLKILNSTLIKELRKYIDKNAKLQQEKELLYGKIEKLEKENKSLKSDFSSMVWDVTHVAKYFLNYQILLCILKLSI